MDIAALSSSMSQASLAQAVSIRVMALAKNTAEQQSQNVVQLLSQNIHPNLGKSLDIKV